jgi:DNA-binding MarR family transcriptional regulator
MYQELNPLLLSQLRLAIMSYLMVAQEAEFNVLKEKTEATAGNLSAQVSKLQEAGYIACRKNLPQQLPAHALSDHPARHNSL